ncbi:phytoene synthase [Novosphingobium chloroacetimidivorans]|uniref:Phytoene synthase n=2 Tax=Novosphingobium chloroacetimidivorans TaxID=1428314 RepID=A0A7W7NU38_9SPHN|nr:phytoene synthase [Novosphingobium chloroacetimidivorans]
MDQDDPLVATLPAVARLALVYAPAGAREQTLALLALDARLATLIRRSSEPMLAQLRLAWWRESIGHDPASWPQGEPILATLRSWGPTHAEATGLVDAWEALTAPSPLGADAMRAFAEGRGAAAAALARVLGRIGDADAAAQLGRIWGIEDLAMRLGREEERTIAIQLAAEMPGKLPRVGRSLRPLRVLAGLTRRRRLTGSEDGAASPAAMLEALKLGLLGL